MQFLTRFAKIFLGLIAVAGLAVTAALLPASQTQTGQGLFSITKEKNPGLSLDNQENIDLLFFSLDPIGIIRPFIERTKIARPREDTISAVGKQPILEPELANTPRQPAKVSNIILAVNPEVEATAQKTEVLVAKETEIRVAAVRQESASGCDKNENPKAAQKCRDEVSFQKSIIEGKPEWCNSINDLNLKKRCLGSF